MRVSKSVGLGFAILLGLTPALALAQADKPSGAQAGTPAGIAPAGAAPTGAAAVSPTPANPAATADAPASLTGTAAWAALVGNTITGKSATGPFSQYFAPNGSVKYVDSNGLSTGTWAAQGDKVCFDYPEDDDRSCSRFDVNGTSGTYADDDGVPIHFEILAGNPKGL